MIKLVKKSFLFLMILVAIFTMTSCGDDIQIYTENGRAYLNFGRYPQTVVSDEKLIKKLEKITETNSLGYIEYKGEEYKRQVADGLNSKSIFQNGDEVVDGKTYYFKVEPIKWRVLETANGSYKLLSECVLDTQQFYASLYETIIMSPNSYKYSNMRAWLNGYNGTSYGVEDYTNKGFIDIAFTEEEKAIIKTTLVEKNTNDRIYLLSVEEAINTIYGFDSNQYAKDSAREANATDYAIARFCSIDEGKGRWWLRSPDEDSHGFVIVVDVNGSARILTSVECRDGVRAVLEINYE